MDLTSVKNIKDLLKKRGLRPSKRFGQNFLVDREAVRKVTKAADLQAEDTVLEIGPGLGALTRELAKKAKRVIAVEKDREMVQILGETLKDYRNIEIVQEDIRNLLRSNLLILRKFGEIQPLHFKVVGNLPFYLTAPVIRKFLEMKEVKPLSLTLVVQKEVGQRICASPAKVFASQKFRRARPPDMNLLAVSVQVYAKPEIISYVSKKSFWPQPEVDAAIVKIIPNGFPIGDMDLFFKIVRAGFSQPRKQLINNLSKGLKIDKKEIEEWLLKNNIKPTQRAETLSIKDWRSLTKTSKILKNGSRRSPTSTATSTINGCGKSC